MWPHVDVQGQKEEQLLQKNQEMVLFPLPVGRLSMYTAHHL